MASFDGFTKRISSSWPSSWNGRRRRGWWWYDPYRYDSPSADASADRPHPIPDTDAAVTGSHLEGSICRLWGLVTSRLRLAIHRRVRHWWGDMQRLSVMNCPIEYATSCSWQTSGRGPLWTFARYSLGIRLGNTHAMNAKITASRPRVSCTAQRNTCSPIEVFPVFTVNTVTTSHYLSHTTWPAIDFFFSSPLISPEVSFQLTGPFEPVCLCVWVCGCVCVPPCK